ncbi:MAG TPA: hypothetical protein DIS66_03035 [Candidatus Omnitrophica bacterium]|nr:hypothetical protein [Candidatus Omnitrophota bacterium]
MAKEIVDFVWGGGAGDALFKVFTRDSYGYLGTVDKSTDILCFSTNPHSAELFQTHPNLKNFNLHTFEMYPQLRKDFDALSAGDTVGHLGLKLRFLEQTFGKNFQQRIRKDQPLFQGAKIQFHPPQKEMWKMGFYQADKFAVIQPFSHLPGRDIPFAVLREILEVLSEAKYMVYLMARKNELQPHQPANFDLQNYFNEKLVADLPSYLNICLLEGTLPAMIHAVEGCDFFIGADAAFLPAAWFYKKQSVFLVPETMLKSEPEKSQIQKNEGRYWGAHFPTTWLLPFDSFKLPEFKTYIQKNAVQR